MTEFESLLVVLLAAVLLAAVSRRVQAPYPAFLAIGGAALALVPGAPRFSIEPDLALALFVAPVLLDAAYDTSIRDLRGNWLPVAGLAVVAVIATTVAVAIAARALVPDMPWPAAIALGAIVAPPDAAAAIAVLRQLRPPYRVLTVLQGESLLNDATALLIYRLAVTALVAHAFEPSSVGPVFLLAVAGSLVVGALLARTFLWLTRGVRDVPTSIILQFISTYGVWLVAERIGLSAVLTMVVYAVTVARTAPARMPARMRVPSYAVWETAVFVLNVLAFVFIGLQIRPVFAALDPGQGRQYVIVALAVLGVVIVVRFAWVMGTIAISRWVLRARRVADGRRPSYAAGIVVSWCGMRGIVTLAAALALPHTAGAAPFVQRDLIVLSAFVVVVGTLVVQGLTLRPLLQRLSLRDDDPVGHEVTLARTRVLEAALASFRSDTSPAAASVRDEFCARLTQLEEGADQRPSTPHDAIRARAAAAARRALLSLRSSGEIGDDAFHVIEEELDRVEMSGGGDAAWDQQPRE